MSRINFILLIVLTAVVRLVVIGAATVIGARLLFGIASVEDVSPTLEPVVEVTPLPTETPAAAPPGETALPTPTVSIPTATTEPTTVATSTTPSVLDTDVQYVMARTDVNIRSGPGTSYAIVGWVAAGQTARVTGISGDQDWWRVTCPDNGGGNCWVTAGARYTEPTSAPVSRPTATPVSACSDAAQLVADITIPDLTQIGPGEPFVKTWRLRNNGTCTWDSRYRLVHAGGHTLGISATTFALAGTVAPGQTIDLSVNMTAPLTPDTYQSDWKLQNPRAEFFGVGRSGGPFWVKIVVPATAPTRISGFVYQDLNQNGVYDGGEPLMAERVVWLVPGTACHVQASAVAVTSSGADGRYLLTGNFSGSYCVGLVGQGEYLDDVVAVSASPGQSLNNIHLQAQVPNGAISGWLWNDVCRTDNAGNVLEGNCVPDGYGGQRADGMIQPHETYIAGVNILLQVGPCAGNDAVPVAAMTDGNGRYTFTNLVGGTYCVSMNAAEGGNAERLLPGNWIFPQPGIWYQEIDLRPGDSAYPVNFGWDFQRR